MMTFAQALHEAIRLQAQIGAPVIDIECSVDRSGHVIAYLNFDGMWETIGFAMPRPYDRERCEDAFIAALAYDACGVTIH